MKRNFIYRIAGMLAACLLFTTAVYGQQAQTAVSKEDGRLCVKLTLDTGAVELSPNEQLTLTPVIMHGEKRVRLAPVVFTGRIRQKVNERRESLSGVPSLPEGAFGSVVVRHSRRHASPAQVRYEMSVPYEPWMAGGELALSRDLEGCAGRARILPPLLLARIARPVQPRLSLIIPADEDPKRRSEQITAVVHFPQGRSTLLRGFADNSRQLGRIDSLTRRLQGNDSLQIVSIFLKGFASPEDTYAFNTRLAQNRVHAIRDYLRENFGLADADFTIAAEPEDWDSLRRWVVLSDLPARDDVLAVIDTVSNPDARDARIWRIDDGKTYLGLLHEVYPQLRRVNYCVEYTLPAFTVEQCRQLIDAHPEWLSLDEICRLAESYALDSPECLSACEVAMEYYPDDPCACNNMAAVCLRTGDVESARLCLSRCAGDPRSLNNLGVLCLIEGDRIKARHCFTLAAENGSGDATYNLAHFDELGSDR